MAQKEEITEEVNFNLLEVAFVKNSQKHYVNSSV